MTSEDKTVFDPGVAVSDGSTTLLDAVLSDAVAQGEIPVPTGNAAIVKGAAILDTYTVETDAIEGGMGSVWRVHHKGWNVDLAMKRPQPQCFSTDKSKADFIHECEAWINLGLHPNIVSCYYVREISGTPTIFSEWMEGGSLGDAIKSGVIYESKESVSTERMLDIAIQFARGLHYAHEAGLIHQDVKPDNLLLTKSGEAKVADFGLAKARAILTVLENDSAAAEPSNSGKTIVSPSGGYTPAYCSIEQMDGKELTRRTDIYSWAVSVMELCIGSRPWANGVVAGLGCRGYFEDTRIPMPEELRKLLERCMSAEPDDRPHDFADIEAKLQEIYQLETGNSYPRPEPKAAADTAESLNNMALSYMDLGRPEEATRLWEQAFTVDPGHVEAIYNHTLYSWRAGKIIDVEAVKRMRTAQSGNACQYAQALLHLERGAGDEAIEALSGSNRDAEVTAVVEEARKVGQPALLQTLTGSTLAPFKYDYPTDKGAHTVSFSDDGTYLYARDRAKTKEDRFTYHNGHVNLWKRTNEGFVQIRPSDLELGQVKWNMHISLRTKLNKLEYGISVASPVVRNGAWYVQDEIGRVRYSHVWRVPEGREYLSIDTSASLNRLACGCDMNTVDVYTPPRFEYKAAWMLCKVRAQNEAVESDELFRKLAEEAALALDKREIQTAAECIAALRPLLNAENQHEYRLLNARLGKYCVPSSLLTIYPDPLWEAPPQPRYGFCSDDRFGINSFDCFMDRDSDKMLWSDPQRSKIPEAVLSPDQKTVAYKAVQGGKSAVQLRSILTKDVIFTYKPNENVGSLQFLPDGSAILVALCESISAVLIDSRNGKALRHYKGRKPHITVDVFVQVSPNGTRFAYGRIGDSKSGMGVTHEPLRFARINGDKVLDTTETLSTYYDYIRDARFSPYDRWFMTMHFDGSVRVWDIERGGNDVQRFDTEEDLITLISRGHLDWCYEFPGFTDWDENARPYLEIFLALHPDWNDANFGELINELQNRGLGFIRPEGVRSKLMEMQPKKKGRSGLFGKRI